MEGPRGARTRRFRAARIRETRPRSRAAPASRKTWGPDIRKINFLHPQRDKRAIRNEVDILPNAREVVPRHNVSENPSRLSRVLRTYFAGSSPVSNPAHTPRETACRQGSTNLKRRTVSVRNGPKFSSSGKGVSSGRRKARLSYTGCPSLPHHFVHVLLAQFLVFAAVGGIFPAARPSRRFPKAPACGRQSACRNAGADRPARRRPNQLRFSRRGASA